MRQLAVWLLFMLSINFAYGQPVTGDFSNRRFESLGAFSENLFEKNSVFTNARFLRGAIFDESVFNGPAEFGGVRFSDTTSFTDVQFMANACFCDAIFSKNACFRESVFHGNAEFQDAVFGEQTDLSLISVTGPAIFDRTKFKAAVNFAYSRFDSLLSFGYGYFSGRINFTGAVLKGMVDFREARFSEYAHIDFNSARISDNFHVGSSVSQNPQQYDFRLAILLDGAKITLHQPVKLKLQHEKIRFLSLPENLDYFTKKVIIDGTKQAGFGSEKYDKQRFELDYLFARSTMYQQHKTLADTNRWYHIRKWPKWFINSIYYWTMGLGFRPFRIIYWMLGIIFFFAIIYMIKFPQKISRYIHNGDAKDSGFSDSIINCLFFSFNLFFTFRLRREIITSFETREKRIILIEWVLGFISYIAFVALAKSGSILHSLKILFMG